eukprot:5153364-Amphidinium_carterae.1
MSMLSVNVLQGRDPEGQTLLPPTLLDTGLRSHNTCCKCRAPDTKRNPLEPCWFKDRKCNHYFCRDHYKTVGFFNPGGFNVQWCNCHDNELLPPEIEDRQRQIPDSDGEYPLDATYDEVTWDARERSRRRHLPEILHEGSSDSQSDTLLMAGDVVADGDQTEPHSIIDRPGRELNAQQIRIDSGDESLSYYTPVEPIGPHRVAQATETQDDIKLKRAGVQGFVLCITQRCITCRLGAPEVLKVYECQAHDARCSHVSDVLFHFS